MNSDHCCGDLAESWDREIVFGPCELPDGHDGPHFDGSWFTDDGEPVEPPEKQNPMEDQ